MFFPMEAAGSSLWDKGGFGSAFDWWSLERPPVCKSPPGCPVCVMGLKVDFAGLPGSLWLEGHNSGSEERLQVLRQQEETLSGLRLQGWRCTVQGAAERPALGVRGKDENKWKTLSWPWKRLYRQAFGSLAFPFLQKAKCTAESENFPHPQLLH